jgi:hypothetical protein
VSIKNKIEKQVSRAADDVNAELAANVTSPAAEAHDAELARALARVERGELVAARRTKNGALLETHP